MQGNAGKLSVVSAKQALREFVDELSELDAREIFPLVSGRCWTDVPGGIGERLSNRELLRLPRALRELIIRRELEDLTDDERDEVARMADELAPITEEAAKLLDER